MFKKISNANFIKIRDNEKIRLSSMAKLYVERILWDCDKHQTNYYLGLSWKMFISNMPIETLTFIFYDTVEVAF